MRGRFRAPPPLFSAPVYNLGLTVAGLLPAIRRGLPKAGADALNLLSRSREPPMSYPAPARHKAVPSSEGFIDLRSDTVTRPSPAMLQAMTRAPVGDDVWGDDPTVNALEAAAAARAGKAAGLFFPTGTQSNLAALMAHCARGDEYIVGQRAHTYRMEGGGAAVLGSIQPQPIENAADGTLPLERIAAEIKPDDAHFARSRLLALENTIEGKVLPAAYVAQAAALARAAGLSLHLDGARAWNAAVASQATVEALCAPFDSVSLCFSKGLGTPAGSVLAASEEVIAEARRARKMLGGAMRQAGILAAACLYALEHNVERLADDHDNAARLGRGLAQIAEIRLEQVNTNMVIAHIPPDHCGGLADHLRSRGVLAAIGPRSRFVLHMDVSAEDVDRAVEAFKAYFAGR
jgi:threonine aldolase